MQLLELRTRVREYLEDEASGAYQWSDTIVNRYINDAVRDFARRTKSYRRLSAALSASATTPTSAFYTVPSDLLEVEALQDTAQGIWLTRRQLSELPDLWQTETGDPFAYLFGEFGWGELRIYPYTVAAQAALRLYYTALPADLSSDTDEPTGIPGVYHASLAYGAVASCYRRNFEDNDVRKAAEFTALYERDVADAIGRAGRKMNGTPVFVPYRDL